MDSLGFNAMDAPPPSFAKSESLLFFKLNRQKRLIIGTAIPLFICFGIAGQLLPRSYKASSEVTVESRTPRPPVRGSDVEAEMPVPFTEDIIGTEIAVISSHDIMSQLVSRLHLEDDPHYNPYLKPSRFALWKQAVSNFVQDYLLPVQLPAPDASREAREWSDTIDAVARSITYTPVPRSRVIEITTSSYDKNLAAKISNTVAELYIASHLGLTQEMNVDANKFLTKRLGELQASATSSGEAVEAYRLAHGLTMGSTSTLLQEQISQLDRELLDARAKQSLLQTEYDSAKHANPEQLSMVVNSQTMARLRDLEASSSAKMTEIMSRYGAHSPELVAYASVLANVRSQILAEARRAVQGLETDLASADANVAALTGRVSAMKVQLGEMDNARAHLETLQAESNAAHNLYSAFLNRSKETDASMLFPSTDVRVVSQATVPTHAAFPRTIYTVPASAILALALASLLGLTVENRRKGITSSSEIEALFHLSTLGLLPIREPKQPDHHVPNVVYRDAVEHLLNRIYFGLQAKSVLITSSLPDEGKTTTARALAEAAASRGLKVLLVDGDLRSTIARPSKTVGAPSGFAEVLRGEIGAEEAIETAPKSTLAILSSGRSRDNPIRLLSLPTALTVFKALEAAFDLIIIDGPPVMVGGDCWMLSQHVDKTIMVVKWGSTPATAIGTALKQLGSIGTGGPSHRAASGVVLNMINRSKSRRLDNEDSVMFEPSIYQYYRQEHR